MVAAQVGPPCAVPAAAERGACAGVGGGQARGHGHGGGAGGWARQGRGAGGVGRQGGRQRALGAAHPPPLTCRVITLLYRCTALYCRSTCPRCWTRCSATTRATTRTRGEGPARVAACGRGVGCTRALESRCDGSRATARAAARPVALARSAAAAGPTLQCALPLRCRSDAEVPLMFAMVLHCCRLTGTPLCPHPTQPHAATPRCCPCSP